MVFKKYHERTRATLKRCVMITINNYFSEIERIGIDNLPDWAKKSHEFILTSTGNGSNWRIYTSSETVRKVVDFYFTKLNKFLTVQQEKKSEAEPERKQPEYRQK